MLQSATQHKAEVDRTALVALAVARQSYRTGDVNILARILAWLQARTARSAAASVGAMLAEQSLTAPPVARLNPQGFTTAASGAPLVTLLKQADTQDSLDAIVRTQIADTDRIATGVATAARPRMTGYIRNVGPKCCKRCAVLAGVFYPYSDGFLRHPNCMCSMVPTTSRGAEEQIETADDLAREGRITDLTQAESKAIADGADVGQVVNVRRKAAGLKVAGRVLTRGDRPTPEYIYQVASDRAQAIDLLRRFGYLI